MLYFNTNVGATLMRTEHRLGCRGRRNALLWLPTRKTARGLSTAPCDLWEFSTRFRVTSLAQFFALSGHLLGSILRAFGSPLQVVRQVVKEQVVGATTTVDKSRIKNQKPSLEGKRNRKPNQ